MKKDALKPHVFQRLQDSNLAPEVFPPDTLIKQEGHVIEWVIKLYTVLCGKAIHPVRNLCMSSFGAVLNAAI